MADPRIIPRGGGVGRSYIKKKLLIKIYTSVSHKEGILTIRRCNPTIGHACNTKLDTIEITI